MAQSVPSEFTYLDNPAKVASWADRVSGIGGTVGSLVPGGFAAYGRIFHPAVSKEGEPVTWRQVCRETRRVPHPLMQWSAITRSTQAGWIGGPPDQGSLPARQYTSLLTALQTETDPAAPVVIGLWEGYGWIPGTTTVSFFRHPVSTPAAFPSEVMEGPRLVRPGRRYLLFATSLGALLQLPWRGVSGAWQDQQTPNLIWDADLTWFVASEVDLDSTIVGGTKGLIASLEANPSLETHTVELGDSLKVNADTVNLEVNTGDG